MATALAQAQAGDDLSFAEIVREHQGMVFSIAYHFLHNRWLAEEVSQDIFLQLHQNLLSIQSPAHLIYWLRRVAAHRCIDQSRRSKPEMGLDEVPEPAVISRVSDPLLSEQLRRSVASLPEKWRMMVVLRYQEGLALEEISDLMDVPVNTVKSGLQRSMALLRRKLSRKLGEIRYALF